MNSVCQDYYRNRERVFSDAEKEACRPVVGRLLELARIARHDGLLALEKEVRGEPDRFLRAAVLLVCDGMEPELLRQVLYTSVLADGAELSKLLVADGILAIQEGLNAKTVTLLLNAALGERYIQPAIRDEKDMERRFNAFLTSMKDKKTTPGSEAFEEAVCTMDFPSVQELLKTLTNSVLSAALRTCGYDAIHKILNSVSRYLAVQITDEWAESECPPEYISACQNEVLDKLREINAPAPPPEAAAC